VTPPAEGRDVHPRLSAPERRRLFVAGIDHFNRGEFFAAHETWEEIWRSTTPEPRDLFQGLIQVAAGLHLQRALGRPRGALRTLAKGRRRLEGFLPASHGLDLAALLAAVAAWEDWISPAAAAPGSPAAAAGPVPPLPRLRVLDPGGVA
jgi:predicted metal-dependent hydrolase